jgi:hypothetical protein
MRQLEDTAAGILDDETSFQTILPSAPQTHEEACRRFHQAATKIREWQAAQRPVLSDKVLVDRFSRLGSTKTYKRALDSDFADLKDIMTKWAPRYEAVWEEIECSRDNPVEDVYHDMPFLQPVMESALRLVQVAGLKRFMIIEGDTGHGKTFALRAIKQKIGDKALMTEADTSWCRPATAAGDMLIHTKAVEKVEQLPVYMGQRLTLLKRHLLARRVLLIDELQHFSGQSLDIIKTIINQTNSVVIGAGMATLIAKLSNTAAEEARQLTHNRLFARHRLTGPGVADAKLYFSRRLDLQGAETQKMEKAIHGVIYQTVQGQNEPIPVAAQYGGMAYLRNIVDECINNGNHKADAADITEAAKIVRKQVTGR